MKMLRKNFAIFAPRQLAAKFRPLPDLLKFTAAAGFLALLSVPSTYSNTITVHQAGGGDHTTINDAMAAANPNVDVVEIIDTATYSESIVAASGVDLISNAVPQPIIVSASPSLPALTLNGSNVSGITFSNSGKHLGALTFVGALEITPNVGTSTISGCTFTANACGVMVDNVASTSGDLVTIADCVFIERGRDYAERFGWPQCRYHSIGVRQQRRFRRLDLGTDQRRLHADRRF